MALIYEKSPLCLFGCSDDFSLKCPISLWNPPGAPQNEAPPNSTQITMLGCFSDTKAYWLSPPQGKTPVEGFEISVMHPNLHEDRYFTKLGKKSSPCGGFFA